jgi:hypothetical protein
MQKKILYSLILHILVAVAFLVNFQFSKKPKKVSSQQFVVNIGGNPKEIKKDQPPIPEKITDPTPPKELPEIKKIEEIEAPVKKVEIKQEEKKIEKVERVEKAEPKITKEEVKKEVPKPEEKKPEKIEKKDIKKDEIKKKEVVKPEEKKVNKEEKKEIKKEIKKEEKKEKKQAKPTTQPVKKESQSDVFSQLLGDAKENPSQNVMKVADLSDDDLTIIRGQISRNWNKTPCLNSNGIVNLEISINANCEIINAKIQDIQKYSFSQESLACANSALRAAQQVEKFDLNPQKCKEIGNELIVPSFSTGS